MKKLALVLLSLALVTLGGCVAQETDTGDAIFEDVTPQEANTLIQLNISNADFVILDVRTALEFSVGHLEGAVNIDFYSETFQQDIDALAKDKIYLIYCRTDNRSGQVLDLMGELGFTEVYNMDGGIDAWDDGGLPVVS